MKRAARERLENLRWRSTAKTLERRLAAAVADGDSARAAEEQRCTRPVARQGGGAWCDPPESCGSEEGSGGSPGLRLSRLTFPARWARALPRDRLAG